MPTSKLSSTQTLRHCTQWSVWFVALSALCLSTHAQTTASQWGIGILHIDPRSTSGPLTVSEIGGSAVDQPQAGSAVSVSRASTVTLIYERFVTDDVSLQAVFGLPPKHKLRGAGTLAAVGEIGEGRQYSPTLLAKYHFADATTPMRPFVGVGVNYTWFRQSRITNEPFRQASYGPNSRTAVKLSDSWNPVATAGVGLRLDDGWSLTVSLGYAPLKTRITVVAEDTALGVPVTVITDVKMRTLASGAVLSRRF